MKWFVNLRISKKLILAFLMVAVVAAAVGAVGIRDIIAINNADTLLYQQNTLGLVYSGEASTVYQRIRYNVTKLTIVKEAEIDKCIADINEYSKQLDDAIKNYRTTISTNESEELINRIEDDWNSYKENLQQVFKLVDEGKQEEAQDYIIVKSAQLADDLRENFTILVDMDAKEAKIHADSNDKLADDSIKIMIVTIVIGVMIAVFLGLYISNLIGKPINLMVQTADKLAMGDVEVNVSVESKDEVGKLAASFNKMIENIRAQAKAAQRIAEGDLTVDVVVRSDKDLLGLKLHELVVKNNEVLSNIAFASEQVAVGAKQVSDSSISLSQGATEQASSVEELTASLEQISSQTDLNANNAEQANELAKDAKYNAVQGNDQMKEMVRAMEEINESSANISKVIKVIDDIAFQTNILALNAAVEAARAGQHGKGFAVVAEEVRNLAARSANAAKETTDMIESSIKKAEGGTKIAKETAVALNKIVDGVEKVASLVGKIAVASNEQALGISQVNQGIMQVSQVVQTNSATSEESAAASEELSSQASLLKEEINKFKLKKSGMTYVPTENISPRVMMMLDQMSEKYPTIPKANIMNANDETSDKRKIILSDKEFGKY